MPTIIIEAFDGNSLRKYNFAEAVIVKTGGRIVSEKAVIQDMTDDLSSKNIDFRKKMGYDRPDLNMRKNDLIKKLDFYPDPIEIRLINPGTEAVLILVGDKRCSIYTDKITPMLEEVRKICKSMWGISKVGSITEDNWSY